MNRLVLVATVLSPTVLSPLVAGGCNGGGNSVDDAAGSDSAAGGDADGTGTDTPSDSNDNANDNANDNDDDADADETAGDDGDGDALQGELLLSRLAGLWAAPVTSETSVGDFPIMNMDVRPAGERTLFSRVDLDSDNNLRFAFTYEDHPELGRVLVFRNGGFFQGILRDTRTALVEFDAPADTWRFCAIAGGCSYIDARIMVSDDGALDLSVDVLRMHHIHWAPSRVEPRELEGPFPPDDSAGAADDPFPTMPTLQATLSWTNAADEGESAWLLLFTEPCMIGAGECNPARFYRATVEAGQTEVTLPIEQIHAGEYRAIAVLDRNGNLASTLLPDNGDMVSLPNVPVSVAPTGTSTANIDLVLEL